MKVEDLLNPVQSQTDIQELRCEVMQARPSLPQDMAYSSRSSSQTMSYTSQSPPMAYSPSAPVTKKQKMRKDAPIIRKAQTKGVVQFPPHEAGDNQTLAAQYKDYQIDPNGDIAEHCHKYPYSSDKKEFQENTGRDGFEVFQYTYIIPGDTKEYTVMWDYNIGLVRITPFFKSCKYSKTTPAKVLNVNPGLKNISYSITGGALAAQGYWMPFQCAKAVAETFAYSIRYALIPIFGKDFLDTCLRPEHPGFGSFKIDPTIVAQCQAETKLWPLRNDARATPASSRTPSEAPGTPRPDRNILQSKQLKELRPKLENKAASPESGYGTDTDGANSTYSPVVSPKNAWASINRPETPASMPITQPLTPATVVSSSFGVTPVKSYTSSELESANALLQLRRNEVLHHGLVPPLSTTPCPPNSIPRSTMSSTDNNTLQAKRRLSGLNEDYTTDQSSTTSESAVATPTPTPTAVEAKGKGNIFGNVAKALKSGTGEAFKATHREKRPRFMSV